MAQWLWSLDNQTVGRLFRWPIVPPYYIKDCWISYFQSQIWVFWKEMKPSFMNRHSCFGCWFLFFSNFIFEHHSGFALWLICGVCTNTPTTYESYSSKVFYDKKRAWMPSKAGIKKSLMMVLVMCAFRVSITIRYRHSHFLNPRNYDAGVMITDWFDNYNIQSCAKKYRKLVCIE